MCINEHQELINHVNENKIPCKTEYSAFLYTRCVLCTFFLCRLPFVLMVLCICQ